MRQNQIRQPKGMKVWYNDKNQTFWLSVVIHNGRTSRTVRGPEARTMEVAKELLVSALDEGLI